MLEYRQQGCFETHTVCEQDWHFNLLPLSARQDQLAPGLYLQNVQLYSVQLFICYV